VTAPQIFCLDTSFFINGWQKRYRISVFPSLWHRVDELIGKGSVFSCAEVFHEIERQKDDLYHWAKRRRECFPQPTEEVIAEIHRVMVAAPNFAAAGGAKNAADPWVIAQAIVSNAAVVTDESPSPKQRSTKPPRLPDICDRLGVPWTSPIEFLELVNLEL
jgi:hypothetical protein